MAGWADWSLRGHSGCGKGARAGREQSDDICGVENLFLKFTEGFNRLDVSLRDALDRPRRVEEKVLSMC